MSRIASVFARPNHTALIPYVTVGYPTVETTLKAVPLFASVGCDIIELGIPFSDPLADGATIQRASYEALRQGIDPEVCFEVAQELRRQVEIPLVFMTYYNPVLRFGPEQFCSKCAEVGIDGLIIPDLPPEEGKELEESTKRHGLDLVYLLSPASTEERIKLVTSRSSGFVYLVSLTGVTGARDILPEELESFVTHVRRMTEKPLCVGFGVSTPEQARRVARVADGVIVGSRIIQLLSKDKSLRNACSFVKRLREALS
ncbi:MAG: tryptophan synthase subunit alpha [Dehalococcoidia bacterium]|nr:tryptophan synthase subunit alpha [Dehalococcoidia bacterium]MDH4300121.1 tryptophan synthase subunit alpha [Dehalococcoidia bacterium]MDH4367950.1 tryptophan synthase subunit alpha [Dehalococcoidia bacterium]